MENLSLNRDYRFWIVQIPGWLLLIYLIIAQGVSAINYDLGVRMGTQESAEKITEVGTAFWYGFAFGDIVFYIPILLMGLIGHILDTRWGRIALAGAFGITVYWPLVCLASLVWARNAEGWKLYNEQQYWIVLPLITVWGLWGLFFLFRSRPLSGGCDAR